MKTTSENLDFDFFLRSTVYGEIAGLAIMEKTNFLSFFLSFFTKIEPSHTLREKTSREK